MNHNRHLKFLVLFVLLLLQSSLYGQNFYEVISTSKLNIRNAPSATSLVVGTLNPGDEIFVFNTKGEWAVFNYKNKLAYVFMKYLKECEKKQEETIDTYSPTSINQETVSEIPQKDTATVLEEHENMIEVLPQKVNHKGTWNFHLIGNIEGGYTNFACDDISPEYGWGYGANAAIQLESMGKDLFLAQGLFFEFSLGYAKKGSGAFPLNYAVSRLYPIGYKLKLPSCTLYGKAGAYIGYCFSEIDTQYDSFDCELDWGLSAGIGVEYEQIALGVNYEYGFPEVCSSDLSLYNRNIFLSFSYRFLSF